MGFDPYNRFLKIRESIGTLTPKVGAQLWVWRFIPSHFPTLPRAWNVIPLASLLVRTFESLCFGCEPKATVATIDFLLLNWTLLALALMLVVQLWSHIFFTKSLITPWKVFVHCHQLVIKILSSAKKKWLKWVKAPSLSIHVCHYRIYFQSQFIFAQKLDVQQKNQKHIFHYPQHKSSLTSNSTKRKNYQLNHRHPSHMIAKDPCRKENSCQK
jgi:hypothetical protein